MTLSCHSVQFPVSFLQVCLIFLYNIPFLAWVALVVRALASKQFFFLFAQSLPVLCPSSKSKECCFSGVIRTWGKLWSCFCGVTVTLEASSVAGRWWQPPRVKQNIWVLAPDLLVCTPLCEEMLFQVLAELCCGFLKWTYVLNQKTLTAEWNTLSDSKTTWGREHALWPLSFFCLWASKGACEVGTVAGKKKTLLKSLLWNCTPATPERQKQCHPEGSWVQ